jgi:hypothetical protein
MMNEENRSISVNHHLSELDKAYITINYPYPESDTSNTNTKRWTVERALDVAGVDDGQKTVILNSYRTGDKGWIEVREEFWLWCRQQRARPRHRLAVSTNNTEI